MVHTSAPMATARGGPLSVRILAVVGSTAILGAGVWAQSSSGPSGFETLSITRTDPRVNSGGLGLSLTVPRS